MSFARAWLLIFLALAGCALVDQRTFDPHAGEKPVAAVEVPATPSPAPAPPFVVIRFGPGAPDYRPALAAAVKRALARRPDLLFAVVTIVPAQGGAEAQEAVAAAATGTGEDVAEAMVAAGAAPAQIALSVRVDPGVAVKEVDVRLVQAAP